MFNYWCLGSKFIEIQANTDSPFSQIWRGLFDKIFPFPFNIDTYILYTNQYVIYMYYTNKREINSAPKIIARLFNNDFLENLKGKKIRLVQQTYAYNWCTMKTENTSLLFFQFRLVTKYFCCCTEDTLHK